MQFHFLLYFQCILFLHFLNWLPLSFIQNNRKKKRQNNLKYFITSGSNGSNRWMYISLLAAAAALCVYVCVFLIQYFLLSLCGFFKSAVLCSFTTTTFLLRQYVLKRRDQQACLSVYLCMCVRLCSFMPQYVVTINVNTIVLVSVTCATLISGWLSIVAVICRSLCLAVFLVYR